LLEFCIVIAFTVIDQLVKLWAAGPLKNLHGGDLPLIEGVFHFTYVENRGAAFGMLQNARVFFIALTVIVLTMLSVYMVKKRRTTAPWMRVALSFIYAGALGNLIDRAILGYVRDMFDFRLIRFYVFNVADACLTVGACMLVLFLLAEEFKQRSKAKAAAPAQAAEAESLGDANGGEALSASEQPAGAEGGESRSEAEEGHHAG